MEGLNKMIGFQRIAEGRPRTELDWDQVRGLRDRNSELDEMFHWLTQSLDNGEAQPIANFRGVTRDVGATVSS